MPALEAFLESQPSGWFQQAGAPAASTSACHWKFPHAASGQMCARTCVGSRGPGWSHTPRPTSISTSSVSRSRRIEVARPAWKWLLLPTHLDETLAVTKKLQGWTALCGHSMIFQTFPFNMAHLERFELAQGRWAL